MNSKFIYTLSIAAFAAVLFLGNSGGRAASSNAGNTGAPGDEVSGGNPKTCQGCHGVGSAAGIQVTIGVELLDSLNNAVTQYIPNKNYTARATVNKVTGNPTKYGFQLLSLINTGNVSVNGWSNPATNTRISTANGGRSYAEQKTPSVSNVFTVSWKAPAAGKGAITFYSAGCGVNGDGGSGGDGANFTKLVVTEKTTAAEDLQQATFALSILENPITSDHAIFYALHNAENGEYRAALYALNGELIAQQKMWINSDAQRTELPTPNLPHGVYVLQISDNRGKTIAAKLVK